jgi:four helix bundle protein
MRTHKDLEVWKLAIKLASDVYQLTEDYPKKEVFGITSQMKRAAVSIGANIAEGAARQSRKEFTYFLHIALGSASELDTLIEISRVTSLTDHYKLNKLQEHLTIISKMLNSLLKRLKVT